MCGLLQSCNYFTPFCALQVTQNLAPLGKSQGSVSSPLGKGNDLPFTPNNGDSAP